MTNSEHYDLSVIASKRFTTKYGFNMHSEKKVRRKMVSIRSEKTGSQMDNANLWWK